MTLPVTAQSLPTFELTLPQLRLLAFSYIRLFLVNYVPRRPVGGQVRTMEEACFVLGATLGVDAVEHQHAAAMVYAAQRVLLDKGLRTAQQIDADIAAIKWCIGIPVFHRGDPLPS